MHTKSKYPWLRHIDFMIVDLVTMLICFVLAYFIKFNDLSFIESPDWLRLILLFSVLDIVIQFITNPYSGIFKRSYYMEIVRSLQLTVYNMISVTLVLYVFKIGAEYSRAVFIMLYTFYFVLSVITKYLWKKLIVSGKIRLYNTKNISLFVIAERGNIDTVLANVSAGDFDPYDIRGIYLDGEGSGEYKGIPVIGEDIGEYIVKNDINDVLVALPPSRIGTADYRQLIENAVNVHIDVESMIGMQTENQYVDGVGLYKTLSVGAFTFRPGQLLYLGVKRLLDLVFGLLGMLLLIPLTVIINIAYLISGDKARIFYTQERVGQNGKTIRILKFRTMVPDADKMLEELLKDEKYRQEWESSQKLSSDPRITGVGRFLRKTSIDELPQFFNLLKADMSLVGPRPLIKGELEAHGGLKLYQKVKPGITGWWACNGRSNIEYRERLELEYYYIRHFSMYLDILCVLRTVAAVIRKDGAE